MIRWPAFIGVAALHAVVWTSAASAQTGENILLVSNALSQPSDEISQYYAQARTIPSAQIIRLPLPTAEEIGRADYETKIERPIADWLIANTAQDRIVYIVLTKDVPLRIIGTAGQSGSVASVDSELTLLYRKLSGTRVPLAGRIQNPFFQGDAPLAKTERFSHRMYDVYLVARLDGYSVADVKALIDRGLSPRREGVVVLDGKLELTETVGNRWLVAASAGLKRLPEWSDRVVLDTGLTQLTQQSNVIGFYTWGSNALAAKERHFEHQFLSGAIGAEYVSTDARTFKEPPAEWVINDASKTFGGSHQSLIGDLIRDGITGVAGHVAEPYLNGTIRPDILFPAYASGFNLIESFYLATPSLSWQTVVVGDVLCAPFGPKPVNETDLEPPLDPDTELPKFFSARVVAGIIAAGAKPEAAKSTARANVRLAKKDLAGARKALEQAVALDADYLPPQVILAGLHESAQEWDLAIELYQRVVQKSPRAPIVLNNLAHALAVGKNKPADALPFAQRAYSLAQTDPAIGDTLAWVYHLLGKSDLAEGLVVSAARQASNNAETQLHAAFILAAVGKSTIAARYLETAIRLNPKFETQADVKALQIRIRPPK